MTMAEPDIVLTCSKCKAQYKVHGPEMLRVNSAGITQVTLFPVSPLDERKCPSCGTFHAPKIGRVEILWMAMQPKPPEPEPTT